MPVMLMSAAWMVWAACSISECARFCVEVWPRSSVVALASSAFQITIPSTQALMTSANRMTITDGAICRLRDPLGEEL